MVSLDNSSAHLRKKSYESYMSYSENKRGKFPPSCIIRELQAKTINKIPPTLTRMAKIQNIDDAKFWYEYAAAGALSHCWWEQKVARPLVR